LPSTASQPASNAGDADGCYRCHSATEEDDDRETLGKEIWRGKCGQPAQVQLEEDGDGRTRQSGVETGDEWSVVYDTLGVTRYK